MNEPNGIPEDEFKKIAPSLYKSIMESTRAVSLYDGLIKIKSHQPDIFIYEQIEGGVPLYSYMRKYEERRGFANRQIFIPN